MKNVKPFLMLAAGLFLVTQPLIAQLTRPGPVPPQQPPTQKPQEAPSTNLIQVVSLAALPDKPQMGQPVTVKMTVKNLSKNMLTGMTWSIASGDRIGGTYGQGGIPQIPAGAVSEVGATFIPARAGGQTIQGSVLLSSINAEPLADRFDNQKCTVIQVIQVSAQQQAPPGSQPRVVRQALDHEKAKFAGASFPTTVEHITAGQAYNEPNPFEDGSGRMMSDWRKHLLSCYTSVMGNRSDQEAYLGFRLKRGWRVVDYEIEQGPSPQQFSVGGWRWTPPALGSDDPHYSVHLWAEMSQIVWIKVRLWIEGPEGTDPYR